MPRHLTLPAAVALLFLLGGCLTAEPNDGAMFGQSDWDAVTGVIEEDVARIANDLSEELALAALAAVPAGAPGAGVFAAGGDRGLLVPSVRPSAASALLRGVYRYDDATSGWVLIEAAATLELRWTFVHVDGLDHDAAIVVDWGVTESVSDYVGDAVEVPTVVKASLTVDAVQVAGTDLQFAWYTAPTCPDGILEPTRIAIDATIGTATTLALRDVVFAVSSDSLSTSGEVVARGVDGDRVGVSWEVRVDGVIQRSDCFLDGFDATGGAVSMTLFRDTPAGASSLGLDATFGSISTDPGSGAFESVDVMGSVDVDGSAAVTFDGTLGDADGDGVPGDDVVLVFANGDTTTLETLIGERLAAAASLAARGWSLLR